MWPLPALFRFLVASLSCKVQSLGTSTSALTQDFLKGRIQASFFSRLVQSLWWRSPHLHNTYPITSHISSCVSNPWEMMSNTEKHFLLIRACREDLNPQYSINLSVFSYENLKNWNDDLCLKSQTGIQMWTSSRKALSGGVAPRWDDIKLSLFLPHQNPHPVLSTLLHGRSTFLYPVNSGWGYMACFG